MDPGGGGEHGDEDTEEVYGRLEDLSEQNRPPLISDQFSVDDILENGARVQSFPIGYPSIAEEPINPNAELGNKDGPAKYDAYLDSGLDQTEGTPAKNRNEIRSSSDDFDAIARTLLEITSDIVNLGYNFCPDHLIDDAMSRLVDLRKVKDSDRVESFRKMRRSGSLADGEKENEMFGPMKSSDQNRRMPFHCNLFNDKFTVSKGFENLESGSLADRKKEDESSRERGWIGKNPMTSSPRAPLDGASKGFGKMRSGSLADLKKEDGGCIAVHSEESGLELENFSPELKKVATKSDTGKVSPELLVEDVGKKRSRMSWKVSSPKNLVSVLPCKVKKAVEVLVSDASDDQSNQAKKKKVHQLPRGSEGDRKLMRFRCVYECFDHDKRNPKLDPWFGWSVIEIRIFLQAVEKCFLQDVEKCSVGDWLGVLCAMRSHHRSAHELEDFWNYLVTVSSPSAKKHMKCIVPTEELRKVRKIEASLKKQDSTKENVKCNVPTDELVTVRKIEASTKKQDSTKEARIKKQDSTKDRQQKDKEH